MPASAKPIVDTCQICHTPLSLFGPALALKKGNFSLHAVCVFAACNTVAVTVQSALHALQKNAKEKCDCCGKGSANFFCHACVSHTPARLNPAQSHIHCAAKAGWLIAKGHTFAGMCPACQAQKRWPKGMPPACWRKFGTGTLSDISLATLAVIAAAQTPIAPIPSIKIVFSKAVGASYAAIGAARRLCVLSASPPKQQLGMT